MKQWRELVVLIMAIVPDVVKLICLCLLVYMAWLLWRVCS